MLNPAVSCKPGRIPTHPAAPSRHRLHAPAAVQGPRPETRQAGLRQGPRGHRGRRLQEPDVKKLHAGGYYRAKLDHSNRLLLQFARHGGETVCLALEVIENHAYDKSRFLRGAPVDEAKIERESAVEPAQSAAELEAVPLRWLHATRAEFELLDKPIVFDDAQEAVRRLPAPVVLVGSAGSGKTAVTLAKLREAQGRVLYVTQSAYLAQSARSLYDAHGYENAGQEAEFLSYREFLETLRVPQGREVSFNAFRGWFDRHRAAAKALGDLDAHALFEEFRGVIGAQPAGPLSLADYLALGPRQSLLAPAAREAAHTLFGRYRQWLARTGQFDLNLVAHEWQPLARADLRLRRHRRGAGPHRRAARPGAGLPEGAGPVPAVRRLQPDRPPQLLLLGGGEDAVLAAAWPARPRSTSSCRCCRRTSATRRR